MKFVYAVVSAFLMGYLVMLGFKYLHHDIRSVPPIGYWAAYFPTAAIVGVGVTIRNQGGE
jgi:hypothetical protein